MIKVQYIFKVIIFITTLREKIGIVAGFINIYKGQTTIKNRVTIKYQDLLVLYLGLLFNV